MTSLCWKLVKPDQAPVWPNEDKNKEQQEQEKWQIIRNMFQTIAFTIIQYIHSLQYRPVRCSACLRWGEVVCWIQDIEFRGGARLALLSSSTVLWDTFCSNRFFHFYPILLLELETIQNPPSLEPIITAIRMSGHVYIGRTHIQIFHLAAPAPIHLK